MRLYSRAAGVSLDLSALAGAVAVEQPRADIQGDAEAGNAIFRAIVCFLFSTLVSLLSLGKKLWRDESPMKLCSAALLKAQWIYGLFSSETDAFLLLCPSSCKKWESDKDERGHASLLT